MAGMMADESTSGESMRSPCLPGESPDSKRLKLDENILLEDSHHPDANVDCSYIHDESRRTVKTLDSSKSLVQIAPMLKVTDRHFRAFIRQLSCRTELWTEMIVDSTLLHTDDLPRFLRFSDFEHPIVCQLGGSNPETMAQAAKVVADWGYDEININVGCPSDRVAKCGMFGAVLMKTPALVRDIAHAMRTSTTKPITIKTRIGVDNNNSADWLEQNLHTIGATGIRHFVLHARPAWLEKRKLTPAQNRNIPPLNWDRVFCIADRCPNLEFSLNGGVQSLDDIEDLLRVGRLDDPCRSALNGVMVGRAANDKPAFLADCDRRIYGCKSNPLTAESRRTVLEGYMDYLAREQHSDDHNPRHAFPLLRPVVGLFHGTRASKIFRQTLGKTYLCCLDDDIP